MFVNATGAEGGGGYDQFSGGRGGWVQASLSVTAGQMLYIYVGGGGYAGNSFNGGGSGYFDYCGGGGATDVRTISGNLTSRLIVAGGGGGRIYATPGNGGTKLSLRYCFLISTIFCL